MGKIEYSSNNSGGHWWLKDEHWKALEKAGWVVDWATNIKHGLGKPDAEGRWLGALATSASKDNVPSMAAGVEEWEAITGASSTDAGCPCCGQPHSFTFTADDGTTEYGPHTSYEARW